jgi:hypothetical protein
MRLPARYAADFGQFRDVWRLEIRSEGRLRKKVRCAPASVRTQMVQRWGSEYHD